MKQEQRRPERNHKYSYWPANQNEYKQETQTNTHKLINKHKSISRKAVKISIKAQFKKHNKFSKIHTVLLQWFGDSTEEKARQLITQDQHHHQPQLNLKLHKIRVLNKNIEIHRRVMLSNQSYVYVVCLRFLHRSLRNLY